MVKIRREGNIIINITDLTKFGFKQVIGRVKYLVVEIKLRNGCAVILDDTFLWHYFAEAKTQHNSNQRIKNGAQAMTLES